MATAAAAASSAITNSNSASTTASNGKASIIKSIVAAGADKQRSTLTSNETTAAASATATTTTTTKATTATIASSSGSASSNGSTKPMDAFEACKNGCLELVKELVNKSNVNNKEKHGRRSTCLHFAAGFGRKDICEYLLGECGADPRAKDAGGLEPIHNAASFGHSEVVALLLRYKARVDAKDKWSWTPLHEACLKSKLDVIVVLLRHGADVNERNVDEKTAVEVNEHDEDVRALLTGQYKTGEVLEAARTGDEEKLLKLLTPLNVNCHASDGRKVTSNQIAQTRKFTYLLVN